VNLLNLLLSDLSLLLIRNNLWNGLLIMWLFFVMTLLVLFNWAIWLT